MLSLFLFCAFCAWLAVLGQTDYKEVLFVGKSSCNMDCNGKTPDTPFKNLVQAFMAISEASAPNGFLRAEIRILDSDTWIKRSDLQAARIEESEGNPFSIRLLDGALKKGEIKIVPVGDSFFSTVYFEAWPININIPSKLILERLIFNGYNNFPDLNLTLLRSFKKSYGFLEFLEGQEAELQILGCKFKNLFSLENANYKFTIGNLILIRNNEIHKVIILNCTFEQVFFVEAVVHDVTPSSNKGSNRGFMSESACRLRIENVIFKNIHLYERTLDEFGYSSKALVSTLFSFTNSNCCFERLIVNSSSAKIISSDISFIKLFNCEFYNIEIGDFQLLTFLDKNLIIINDMKIHKIKNVIKSTQHLNQGFAYSLPFNIITVLSENKVIISKLSLSNVEYAIAEMSVITVFLFHFRSYNVITFDDLKVSDINMYSGFSQGVFHFYAGNLVNVTDSEFLKIILKSSVSEDFYLNRDKIIMNTLNKSIDFDEDSYVLNFPRVTIFDAFKTNKICFRGIYLYYSFTFDAGFLLATYENYVTIKDAKYIRTFSMTIGGVVVTWRNNTFIANNLSSFENKATAGGFLYAGSENYLQIFGSIFDSIEVHLTSLKIFWSVSGCVLFINDNNHISFYNNKIANLTSSMFGGAIHLVLNNFLMVMNLSAINMESWRSGGFLYLSTGNMVLLQNLDIRHVRSEYNGGMLYINQFNILYVNFTTFSDSWAKKGGLLNANRCNVLYVINCLSNTINSEVQGGLFSLEENNYLSINFSSFYSAGSPLGCVIYASHYNNIKVRYTNCYNTSGGKGGLAFLEERNIIEISKIYFYLGWVWYAGNLINAHMFCLVFINELATYNTTATNGSIVYFEKSNVLNISSSYIFFSESSKNGSFIMMLNNNLLFTKTCIFSNIGRNLLSVQEFNQIIFEGSLFYTGDIFSLQSKNNLTITHSKFLSLYNYNIEGVLLFANHSNIIIFSYSELKISVDIYWGYVEAKFIFLVQSNELHLQNTDIHGEKGLNLFQNTLGFIYCYLKENKVSLRDSAVSDLDGFSDFIYSDSTLDITVFYCKIKFNKMRTLIKSTTRSKIFLVGTKFFANYFSKSYLMLTHSFINITLTTFKENFQNTKFLRSNSSEIIISKVKICFYYKKTIEIINNSSKFYLIGQTRIRITDFSVRGVSSNGLPGVFFIKGADDVNIMNSDFFDNTNIGGFGAILTAIEVGKITVFNNFFMLNSASIGGIFAFYNISALVVEGNTFYFNKADPVSLSIKNNETLDLIDEELVDKSLTLLLLKIQKSSSKGGCFYFSEINPDKIQLLYNKFVLNKALVGSVFYTENFSLPNNIISTHINKFKNNTAFHYGSPLGSNPSSIIIFTSIININEINYANITNQYLELQPPLLSRTLNPDCYFSFIGVDLYQQMTLWDQSLDVKDNILIKPNLQNAERQEILLNFKMNHGFQCVYSITDQKKNPFAKTLILPIDSSIFQSAGFVPQTHFDIKVRYRNCTFGEMFDETTKECLFCSYGFFSFFSKNFSTPSTCTRCVNTFFNCYGGRNLTPKPGYWRSDEESPNFLKCPNRRACLGDMIDNQNGVSTDFEGESPTGECATGYRGVLCAECDKDFGKSDDHKCGDCNQRGYYVKAIFKLFIKLFLFGYSLKKAMNLTYQLKGMKANSESAEKGYSLAATNSIIKIALNHTHILFTLFMFPYDWPPEITETISSSFGLISPGITNSFSFECILKTFNLKIAFLYFQLVIMLLFPFLVALGYIGISFITLYLKKKEKIRKRSSAVGGLEQRRGGFSVHSRLSISEANIIKKIAFSFPKKVSIEAVILLVFMLAFVDIAHAVGNTFFHVNIGYEETKSKRILWQPEIDFESPSHQSWMFGVSVPATIIFGLFFPVYIMIRLMPLKNPKELENDEPLDTYSNHRDLLKNASKKSKFFFRYGYFFYSYRTECFYYEIIYIIRRYIFILFDIFITPLLRIQNKYNPTTFILIATVVLWIFFLIHSYSEPYREEIAVINKLETFSYIALITSYYFASLVLSDFKERWFDTGKLEETGFPLGVSIFFFGLTIIVNTVFFVLTSKYFLVFEGANLKDVFSNLTSVILKLKTFFKLGARRSLKQTINKLCQNKLDSKRVNSRIYHIQDWTTSRDKIEKHISKLKEENVLIKLALKEGEDLKKKMKEMIRVQNLTNKLLIQEIEDLKKAFGVCSNCKFDALNCVIEKKLDFDQAECIFLNSEDSSKLFGYSKEEGSANKMNAIPILKHSQDNHNEFTQKSDIYSMDDFRPRGDSSSGVHDVVLSLLHKKTLLAADENNFCLEVKFRLLNVSNQRVSGISISKQILTSSKYVVLAGDELEAIWENKPDLEPNNYFEFVVYIRHLNTKHPSLDQGNIYIAILMLDKNNSQEDEILHYVKEIKILPSDFAELVSSSQIEKNKKNFFSVLNTKLKGKKSCGNEFMKISFGGNPFENENQDDKTFVFEEYSELVQQPDLLKKFISEKCPFMNLLSREIKDLSAVDKGKFNEENLKLEQSRYLQLEEEVGTFTINFPLFGSKFNVNLSFTPKNLRFEVSKYDQDKDSFPLKEGKYIELLKNILMDKLKFLFPHRLCVAKKSTI